MCSLKDNSSSKTMPRNFIDFIPSKHVLLIVTVTLLSAMKLSSDLEGKNKIYEDLVKLTVIKLQVNHVLICEQASFTLINKSSMLGASTNRLESSANKNGIASLHEYWMSFM